VRGLRALPDGLSPDDLEWEDAPCVVAEIEKRWARWRKAQDSIAADWLKSSRERVQEIAKLVDADKRQQQMDAELAQRDAYFAASEAENLKFVAALKAAFATKAAAKKQEADEWKKQATERLAKATRAINREIVDRERRVFGVRKRR
jgi:hypothetical protein